MSQTHWKNNEEAKKRRMERANESKNANATVQRTTKLTSGQLFRRDMTCLTNHDILREQLDYYKYKSELEKEKKRRKLSSIRSMKSKVRKIRMKSQSNWTVSDYRQMLTYKKNKGDPPSTNVKEKDTLEQWWNERKDRPSPTPSETNSDVDEDWHDAETDLKIEEEHLLLGTDGVDQMEEDCSLFGHDIQVGEV